MDAYDLWRTTDFDEYYGRKEVDDEEEEVKEDGADKDSDVIFQGSS